MTEFSGTRAIVTGGGSGIGLAAAAMLAARGAEVACLDLDPSAVPEPLIGIRADVADDAVAAAVAEAADRMGGIDIVVNNAGIGAQGTVEDNELDEWRRVLDVNVLGMVRVARAALRWLRESAAAGRHPAIVNTCSIAATAGCPAARSTARQGRGLLADPGHGRRHVREGIRVNCVNPAPRTPRGCVRLLAAAADPDAELAALRARQPTGRLVTADEVRGHDLPPRQSAHRRHHRHRDRGRRWHAGLRLRPIRPSPDDLVNPPPSCPSSLTPQRRKEPNAFAYVC